MSPDDLIAWRGRLGLDQEEAAEALGLTLKHYAAFERGYHLRRPPPTYNPPVYASEGKITFTPPCPIPKYIALACSAVEAGLGSSRQDRGLSEHPLSIS